VRYVRQARNGVIYIGIGMHQETLRHTAFPLETSTNFCRPSSQATGFARVYQGADGLSYGILSPNAFRFVPFRRCIDFRGEIQAPPVSAMTLADGRVLSLDEENGILVLTEKSQSGSTIVLPLPYFRGIHSTFQDRPGSGRSRLRLSDDAERLSGRSIQPLGCSITSEH